MNLNFLFPILGGSLAYLLTPYLLRTAPKSNPKLTYVADEIPIIGIENNELVICDDGSAFKVVELEGLITAGKKSEQIKAAFLRRFNFFLHCQEYNVHLRIVSQRFEVPIQKNNSETNNDFLKELTKRWESRLKSSYEIRHYIIISTPRRKDEKEIDEVISELHSFLGDWTPSVLKRQETEKKSPLLSFLATFYNATKKDIFPSEKIPSCLARSRIEIDDNGRIIFDDNQNKHLRIFFGVKDLPKEISDKTMEKVLSLPYEVQTYLHLKPYTKQEAFNVLNYRKNQQTKKNEENKIQLEDWELAGELVEAGNESFYSSEIFFSITLPLSDALETTISKAVQLVLSSVGDFAIRLSKEKYFSQYIFWGQLPGRDYFTRELFLFSSNLADFTPLTRSSAGHSKCDWGERPVCYFPSAPAGNPYGFTFHASQEDQAPPHVVVYAPTGQGKTVLLLHLVGQALATYPDLSVFIFDRDNGVTVFTEFMNGVYHHIGEYDENSIQLNPFDCEDTDFADLQTFLSILTNCTTDQDFKDITDFTSSMLSLPKEIRRMDKFANELAQNGAFKTSLQKWIDPKSKFYSLFNGDKDTLDVTLNRLNAFGLDNVKDNETASSALFFHIFKKIEKTAKAGKPSLVIIDEASTLLKSEALCLEVEKLLKTARKQRMSICLAFQEVSAVQNTPIASTINVNCHTSLFWPGTAKTINELEGFNLTEEETSFILGEQTNINGSIRPVLLHRANDSAFLDTDLSCLKEYISLFKGGAVPVAKMNKAKADFKEEWHENYLKGWK